MCHLSPDDWEEKDHSMNQSVYDEAVYRTAPATLRLFKIFVKKQFLAVLILTIKGRTSSNRNLHPSLIEKLH